MKTLLILTALLIMQTGCRATLTDSASTSLKVDPNSRAMEEGGPAIQAYPAETTPVFSTTTHPHEQSNPILLDPEQDDPRVLCLNGIRNPKSYPIPEETKFSRNFTGSWRNWCAPRLCTKQNNYCSPQTLEGGMYSLTCSRGMVHRCFRTWQQCQTQFDGCVKSCKSISHADELFCGNECAVKFEDCNESSLGYKDL